MFNDRRVISISSIFCFDTELTPISPINSVTQHSILLTVQSRGGACGCSANSNSFHEKMSLEVAAKITILLLKHGAQDSVDVSGISLFAVYRLTTFAIAILTECTHTVNRSYGSGPCCH